MKLNCFKIFRISLFLLISLISSAWAVEESEANIPVQVIPKIYRAPEPDANPGSPPEGTPTIIPIPPSIQSQTIHLAASLLDTLTGKEILKRLGISKERFLQDFLKPDDPQIRWESLLSVLQSLSRLGVEGADLPQNPEGANLREIIEAQIKLTGMEKDFWKRKNFDWKNYLSSVYCTKFGAVLVTINIVTTLTQVIFGFTLPNVCLTCPTDYQVDRGFYGTHTDTYYCKSTLGLDPIDVQHDAACMKPRIDFEIGATVAQIVPHAGIFGVGILKQAYTKLYNRVMACRYRAETKEMAELAQEIEEKSLSFFRYLGLEALANHFAGQ